MISTVDRNYLANYYGTHGIKVVFSNGKLAMGTMKLSRLAKASASSMNTKRKAKGLLPRRVRAGIIGYLNGVEFTGGLPQRKFLVSPFLCLI
ncbi:DAR GTPase 3, chloroplastic-like [Primulina tabacum]|uniref:DAR GTPase 3, chloroplastic-like n=1 Tax=Primulina tabacum TaxID=48773 RepID=UPI003F59EBE7